MMPSLLIAYTSLEAPTVQASAHPKAEIIAPAVMTVPSQEET
jgi:hypothetical protein